MDCYVYQTSSTAYLFQREKYLLTRNRKQCQVATKMAACHTHPTPRKGRGVDRKEEERRVSGKKKE